jgi:hypothetical protein
VAAFREIRDLLNGATGIDGFDVAQFGRLMSTVIATRFSWAMLSNFWLVRYVRK